MNQTHEDNLRLAQRAVEQIAANSAFLLTGQPTVNPMTIGWAGAAWMWQQPTLLVVVRHSRYSRELLDKNGAFTVSVPAAGTMRKELGHCGTVSGRDENKCQKLGLSVMPPRAGLIGALEGCTLHVECETLYRMEGPLEGMDPGIAKQWYPEGDPHTLFFGKICCAYETLK